MVGCLGREARGLTAAAIATDGVGGSPGVNSVEHMMLYGAGHASEEVTKKAAPVDAGGAASAVDFTRATALPLRLRQQVYARRAAAASHKENRPSGSGGGWWRLSPTVAALRRLPVGNLHSP